MANGPADPDVMCDAAKRLVVLGNLVMDLYIGGLQVDEITTEIILALKKAHVFREEEYKSWISESKKSYRTLSISDGSRWTLLWGRNDGRYIHIHPARYSRHSVRIKALPLKTAILLLLEGKGWSDPKC